MEGSASSLLSELEPNDFEENEDEEGYDMFYESIGKSKSHQNKPKTQKTISQPKQKEKKQPTPTKSNEEKKIKQNEETKTDDKVYNLDLLLERLGFEKHQYPHILNVYVFGSRAYKQNTSSSDTDAIIVVSDNMTLPRVWRNFNYFLAHGWISSMHKNQFKECRRDWIDNKEFDIQCSIYPVSTFRKLVNNYVPYAVECLFFPSSCVLKKTLEFTLPNPIDKKALKDSYFGVAGSHYARAVTSFCQRSPNQHLIVKNPLEYYCRALRIDGWNEYAVKKVLCHAYRQLQFAIQLLKKGAIDDLTAANKLRKMIMEIEGEKWEQYAAVFDPPFLAAISEINSL